MIEIESIRRLDVKPGETLVVRIGEHIPADEIEAVADAVRSRLPEGVECLIVAADVELEVVSRA